MPRIASPKPLLYERGCLNQKVRVSFTDDGGNDEQVTSAAMAAVVNPPLTATICDEPSSHNGQDAFTFKLPSSEEFPLSYVIFRDHTFTVTGVK